MDYKTEAEPKAYADGVPVFCAHDKIVDVATLVPNPKNPNKHPDAQIQLLGRIIRQTGWAPSSSSPRSCSFVASPQTTRWRPRIQRSPF